MECPHCGGAVISLRFAIYYEQQVFSFCADGAPQDVGDWTEVDRTWTLRAADDPERANDRHVLLRIAERAGAQVLVHPDHEYACDGCGRTFSPHSPAGPSL